MKMATIDIFLLHSMLGVSQFSVGYFGYVPPFPHKSYPSSDVSVVLHVQNIALLIYALGKGRKQVWQYDC